MDTYLLNIHEPVTETGILDCDMLIKGGKLPQWRRISKSARLRGI